MTMINCGVALETLSDLGEQEGLPVWMVIGREVRRNGKLETLNLIIIEDGEIMPYRLTLHTNGCWALTKGSS